MEKKEKEEEEEGEKRTGRRKEKRFEELVTKKLRKRVGICVDTSVKVFVAHTDLH